MNACPACFSYMALVKRDLYPPSEASRSVIFVCFFPPHCHIQTILTCVFSQYECFSNDIVSLDKWMAIYIHPSTHCSTLPNKEPY